MKANEKTKTLLGLAVFAAGAALMAIGINNDETVVVLQKAIKICMECVGIG